MTAAAKVEKPRSKKVSPRPIRKIMTPATEGTIKRSLIRKVIREVIANRPGQLYNPGQRRKHRTKIFAG
jgi:hypothetical protein